MKKYFMQRKREEKNTPPGTVCTSLNVSAKAGHWETEKAAKGRGGNPGRVSQETCKVVVCGAAGFRRRAYSLRRKTAAVPMGAAAFLCAEGFRGRSVVSGKTGEKRRRHGRNG